MKRWRNFDLELFDHNVVDRVESFKVRVARSPAGVQREPVSVQLSPALRDGINALVDNALDLQQTIGLGKQLGRALLPGVTGELFAASRAQLADDEGLRLRIELRSLALADIPWEYTYQASLELDQQAPERGFLALQRRLSIVRYEPVAQPPSDCAALDGEPVDIALMLANPAIPNWPALDVEAEVRAIESALEDEPDLRLSVHRGATDRSLNNVLDSRPHVFHFSGHGRFQQQSADESGTHTGKGELLLESDAGGPAPIAAEQLAAKMRGTGVRLAVLNGCETARRDAVNAFTGVAPTLVRDGVPAVIAMQYSIRDDHAIRLARRLYHNLAEHQSIDAAVTAARLAIFHGDDQYDRDWGLPVLYLRSDQSVLFPDPAVTAAPRLRQLGKHGLINLALATGLVFAMALFYLKFVLPRLPFGTAVGGVVAVSLLAAVGFLKTVAGDSLRNSLLTWLRRKTASGVLLAGLVAAAVGLGFASPPSALRVIAGKSLASEIARNDLAQPLRIYRLSISANGRIAIADDFRKAGVTIAASENLASRLSDRYSDEITASIDQYLEEQSLGAHRDAYLRLWQSAPDSLAFSRFGSVRQIKLLLEHADAGSDAAAENWRQVACRSVDRNQTITAVFLEKGDEC